MGGVASAVGSILPAVIGPALEIGKSLISPIINTIGN